MQKITQQIVNDVRNATAFLSRLPVGTNDKNINFEDTAHTFPIAGVIIAVIPAILLYTLSVAGLPDVVAAVIAMLALVIITGAMHEDGLADLVDGFFGGTTKKQKLEIMSDSRIGAYGVIAIVFSLAIRTALVTAIMQTGALRTAMLIIVVAGLSRAAIIYPWWKLKPAKQKNTKSTSKEFGQPSTKTLRLTYAVTLPIILLLLILTNIGYAAVSLIIAAAAAEAVTRMSEHHIGGHTGDCLGATQQVTETGLWFGLLVMLQA